VWLSAIACATNRCASAMTDFNFSGTSLTVVPAGLAARYVENNSRLVAGSNLLLPAISISMVRFNSGLVLHE
jgi:hypothetical protein